MSIKELTIAETDAVSGATLAHDAGVAIGTAIGNAQNAINQAITNAICSAINSQFGG